PSHAPLSARRSELEKSLYRKGRNLRLPPQRRPNALPHLPHQAYLFVLDGLPAVARLQEGAGQPVDFRLRLGPALLEVRRVFAGRLAGLPRHALLAGPPHRREVEVAHLLPWRQRVDPQEAPASPPIRANRRFFAPQALRERRPQPCRLLRAAPPQRPQPLRKLPPPAPQ